MKSETIIATGIDSCECGMFSGFNAQTKRSGHSRESGAVGTVVRLGLVMDILES